MEKQEQNGSVNGTHLKSIVDPYDELIKNHLRNEEKVKVRIVFTQNTSRVNGGIQQQTIKIISIFPLSLIIHVNVMEIKVWKYPC